MKNVIGLVILLGAATVGADEVAKDLAPEFQLGNKRTLESPTPGETIVSTDLFLADIHHIEKSVRDFQISLESGKLTPEQRALQIEQFHQLNREPLRHLETLKRQADAAGRAADDSAVFRNADHEITFDPPAPSDPILADIHEIENGVRDFQLSLETQKLTPEQRAIQIEQFHQLNHEALLHLETLKLQSATQSRLADIPTNMEPANEAIMPVETTRLKREIDRVMRDLSQVDPETRAQYLEAHAATLETMSREISSQGAAIFPNKPVEIR